MSAESRVRFNRAAWGGSNQVPDSEAQPNIFRRVTGRKKAEIAKETISLEINKQETNLVETLRRMREGLSICDER